MAIGHRDVQLTGAAFAATGASPTDFPLTVRDGQIVRLGKTVQVYLSDHFELGSGPLPEPLPLDAQTALVQSLLYAEPRNYEDGKRGKNAIIYTADLADALGHDGKTMESRYKAPASRFK